MVVLPGFCPLPGPEHRGGPGSETAFDADVPQVTPDSPFTKAQSLRDLPIRLPQSEQRRNFLLAAGERGKIPPRRR